MLGEREIFKQNSFSRSLINEAKAGAYYTDTAHCRSIGELFEFPEEQFCVLEPSIGDASAVKAVIEAASDAKIFGVELQKKTAEEVSPRIEACLNADFLTDVRISNNVFSFCFANPPYGTDAAKQERYEKQFLDKLYNYLSEGARIAYVIPFYVLTDEKFYKLALSRFVINAVYKFRMPVYEQFQQIVMIGTKKSRPGYSAEDLTDFNAKIENITELPEHNKGEKLAVMPSSKDDIKLFTRVKFDAEAAMASLVYSPLNHKIGEKFATPVYRGNEVSPPVIPLSNDMYYLLAISGAGQGIAGSREGKDIHLQRGCVQRVKSERTETDENGNTKIVEREFSSVTLTIIEQSGKITRLK